MYAIHAKCFSVSIAIEWQPFGMVTLSRKSNVSMVSCTTETTPSGETLYIRRVVGSNATNSVWVAISTVPILIAGFRAYRGEFVVCPRDEKHVRPLVESDRAVPRPRERIAAQLRLCCSRCQTIESHQPLLPFGTNDARMDTWQDDRRCRRSIVFCRHDPSWHPPSIFQMFPRDQHKPFSNRDRIRCHPRGREALFDPFLPGTFGLRYRAHPRRPPKTACHLSGLWLSLVFFRRDQFPIPSSLSCR